MSILARQREKDPSLGYARDFVDVARSLAPTWKSGRKLKVITNAGGLNPRGCADAVAATLRSAGAAGTKIGIGAGDDVSAALRENPTQQWFRHLETGEPLSQIADRL